jgi:hypothetical protein
MCPVLPLKTASAVLLKLLCSFLCIMGILQAKAGEFHARQKDFFTPWLAGADRYHWWISLVLVA